MYLSHRIYKDVSGPDFSFSFKQHEQAWFYDKYHHHPEYEFTYIAKGKGIRFAGDQIEAFQEGDMVLLGPNLSHMWKCDRSYYQQNHPKACCSYVIHFPGQLLENSLLALPEMAHIRLLLEKSKRGIKIEGTTKKLLAAYFQNLPRQSSSERFLTLINMLHHTASSKELQLLSQSYVSIKQEDEQSERLNAIYNYLLSHLHQKISLQQVASVASMAPTAFCRFFKQKTNKSFTSVLNEIRIKHACRLLMEGNKKIAQIALESGFSNLSHFNKQFREIIGKTPGQYLKQAAGQAA